eukprot:CAMPEP_0181245038 /NCGR_PEP_ID=MMETSP1096-20121128/43195_1 /TAXON_ID=156174 ORGANISM="Chrysochromulina ericina, Strain CCMP281" /NCGR_SAMPLE_ID=MMETSP1096 /ASSEMBLY_ACC=CAM_ASM_000453 /LENGTH=177 /DNA_ID=CAMNT_0023341657 /DNA_START=293 /DNA_END=826 /DNA_ORIENTATION=+
MSLARHRHPSSIVSFRTVTISSCDEPPAAAPSSKLPPCLLQQRAPRPARRDQKPIPVLQPRPRAGVGSRCVAKFGCDRVSEGMRRVGRSWPHHRVVAIMVAAPQLAPALHLRRGLFEIAGVHLKPSNHRNAAAARAVRRGSGALDGGHGPARDWTAEVRSVSGGVEESPDCIAAALN